MDEEAVVAMDETNKQQIGLTLFGSAEMMKRNDNLRWCLISTSNNCSVSDDAMFLDSGLVVKGSTVNHCWPGVEAPIIIYLE